jgi:hypothetical protein
LCCHLRRQAVPSHEPKQLAVEGAESAKSGERSVTLGDLVGGVEWVDALTSYNAETRPERLASSVGAQLTGDNLSGDPEQPRRRFARHVREATPSDEKGLRCRVLRSFGVETGKRITEDRPKVLAVEALKAVLSLVGRLKTLVSTPHHIEDLAGNPVIITGNRQLLR